MKQGKHFKRLWSLMLLLIAMLVPQGAWAANHYDAGYESTATTYSAAGIKFKITAVRMYNYQGNNSHFNSNPVVTITAGGHTHTFNLGSLTGESGNSIFYYNGEGNENPYKGSGSFSKRTYEQTVDGIPVKAYFDNQKNEQRVSTNPDKTYKDNGDGSSKWCTADLTIEIGVQTAATVTINGNWRDESDGINKTESYSWSFDIPMHSHVYGSYSSNNDATCTDDGTKSRWCDYCGAEDKVTDTGSAFDHSYNTNGICIHDHSHYQPAPISGGYYLINNPGHLEWFAKYVNANAGSADGQWPINAKLTADIDLTGIQHTPIGTSEHPFYNSVFDGQGHTISNMKFINYDKGSLGLFGVASGTYDHDRTTICNFTITGEMTSQTSGLNYIAGVVGLAGYSITVRNVVNRVNITLGKNVVQHHIGGIAGNSSRIYVEDCINEGNIYAGNSDDCVAGIVAYTTGYTHIYNSLNVGSISSDNDNAFVGGILGYQNNNRFSGVLHCLNTGTIKGGNANTYAGAIYGYYRQPASNKGGNNYYLGSSAAKAYGKNDSTDDLNALISEVTAEQVYNGYVAYRLNSGKTDGTQKWYQALGTGSNTIPSLVKNAANTVYELVHKKCDGTTPNGNITYTNNFTAQPTVEGHGLAEYTPTYTWGGTHDAATCIFTLTCNLCNKEVTSQDLTPTKVQAYHVDATCVKDGNERWTATGSYSKTGDAQYNGEAQTEDYVIPAAHTFDHHVCTVCTADEEPAYTGTQGECTWRIYVSDGEMIVSPTNGVSGSLGDWGGAIPSWLNSRAAIKSVRFTGTVMAETLYRAFECCAIKSIDFTNLNTSQVKDMNGLFMDCMSLNTINWGSFDTSNATNMYGMFTGCSSLKSLDLRCFNTSNVTDMDCMFFGCYLLTSIDLSNFDMSKATNCTDMFVLSNNLSTLTLTSVPYLKAGTFDTKFAGKTVVCKLDEKSTIYKGENPGFPTVASVTAPCSLDLTGSVVENHANLTRTGHSYTAQSDADAYLDSAASNCTDATYFYKCANCDEHGTETWAKAGTAKHAYDSDHVCTLCETKDPGIASGTQGECNWIIYSDGEMVISPSNGTAGSLGMWESYPSWSDASGLAKTVRFEGKITAQTAKSMFANFTNLTSLDLSNLNTADVTTMESMFQQCSSLESLDLSSLNTVNVTSMAYMFDRCSKLTSVDLSSFNTENVTTMQEMFYSTKSLTSLDLSSFDTKNVTSMVSMFRWCTFSTLTIANFNMLNVSSSMNIFSDCTNLNNLILKSIPYLRNSIKTQFSGEGKTVICELNENSVIYTGSNPYFPAVTSVTAPCSLDLTGSVVEKHANLTRTGHKFTVKSDADAYLASAAASCRDAIYFYKCANCTEHNSETWAKAGTGIHTFDDETDPHHTLCTVCDHSFFRYTATAKVEPFNRSALMNSKNQGIYDSDKHTFDGKNGVMEFDGVLFSIGNSAFFRCSGFTGNLIIPNSVTSIGRSAFEGCGFTGNLIIPNSVTSIGNGAFAECSVFTGNLTIPISVTSIGDYAFNGCSGFTGNLIIPNSVTSIGNSAFQRCSGFNGNLIIPNSVTSIGNSAFNVCSGFTGNLIIPNSVTSIGNFAFQGCSRFTGNLTIGNSVTSIGEYAFDGCSRFTGIEFQSVPQIGGSRTFSNVISNKTVVLSDKSKVYKGSNPNFPTVASVTAPCSLDLTGSAVANHANLTLTHTKVTDAAVAQTCTTTGLTEGSHCEVCHEVLVAQEVIPSHTFAAGDETRGVCTVCNHGFFRYTATDKVTPDDGTLLDSNGNDIYNSDKHTFADGKGVIEFDKPLATIGSSAFEYCSYFTGDLIIPNSVTSIGDCAFSWCDGFTGNLTIPNSVTSIGDWAFYECSNFTGNLTIPNSVTSIGYWAFDRCTGFTGVKFLSVPSVELDAFAQVTSNKTVVLSDNSYVYTGENPYFPAVQSASYTRRGIKNQWGTIVVPFEVNGSGDDYDLYTLSSVSDDELTLTKVDGTLAAGTPTLIRINSELVGNGKTYNLTLTASTPAVSGQLAEGSAADGLQLVGTYQTTELSADDYFIANNKFWRAGDMSATVKAAPFRAYLHGTAAGAKAGSFGISIADENVTAVETLNAINEGTAEYYDLNGRRIPQLQKGVNVVKYGNGKTKKIIIK